MKKNNTVLITIIVLFVMFFVGLGYAYLSSNLSITGATGMSGNTWNIHFANIDVEEGSVQIDDGSQGATIDIVDNTRITYAIVLSKPGDYYAFNVDIVNTGTIDGMIDTISLKINNQDVSNYSYLDATITYSDGIPIDANHLLEAGESLSIYFKIEYKRDITEEQLLATNAELSGSLSIVYRQSNDTAIDRNSLITNFVYLYRNNNAWGHDLSPSYGQSVDELGLTYSSAEDVLSTISNSNFIRNKVEDGMIIGADLGFKINNNTYYLIGPGYIYDDEWNEWNYSEAPYEANKTVLYNAFGTDVCSDFDDYVSCYDPILEIEVEVSSSNMYVYDKNNNGCYCRVDNDGFSDCSSDLGAYEDC